MAFSLIPSQPRHAGKTAASLKRLRVLLALGAGAALVVAGITAVRLTAQVEGDRGITPLATSADIEVSGIDVDVTGKNGAEARLEGWKEAEKLAWKKVGGPDMPIESIDAMVASVVIEHEQVGPRRYKARLGVIFDKGKASQLIGVGGVAIRSAPLLTIPVLYQGGVAQVYEVRGPWQRAWAEYQDSQSPIQYVRPSGSGGESLIVTAGQTTRRSRLWWRTILDQFAASDVLMPVARLERQWPGGPVHGLFTARYGPDSKFLGSFELNASSEQDVPAMMDEAVRRMDGLYRDALAQGLLTPDPTLNSSRVALDRAFAELRKKLLPEAGSTAENPSDLPATNAPQASPSIAIEDAVAMPETQVSVQFPSPDAAAVDSALAAVRGASGVSGAATVSLAIGGTSVLRVVVAGGADRLAAGLRAQGWKVSGAGGTLRISR